MLHTQLLWRVHIENHHVNLCHQDKSITGNISFKQKDFKKCMFNIQTSSASSNLCCNKNLYHSYTFNSVQKIWCIWSKGFTCEIQILWYWSLLLLWFVFFITLLILCSVQAFMVRKLPANYNETFYIFLGTFTTTNLLTLSIPLNANFNTDGQKIFVNSLVISSANMALTSIAYGYEIHMLLKKHRNTKEAFQKIMQWAMQDNFKKLKKRLRND